MSIMDIILTGLAWILAAAVVIGVVAIVLLATWMQVNDRKVNEHGQSAEAAQSRQNSPAVYKRRRTAV